MIIVIIWNKFITPLFTNLFVVFNNLQWVLLQAAWSWVPDICSKCEFHFLRKIQMHNIIVSHFWKRVQHAMHWSSRLEKFTCVNRLFHMCEKKFNMHCLKFTCKETNSHVWKHFSHALWNFHMQVNLWCNAHVEFPGFISHGSLFSHVFHVLFTWFSHTYPW